MLGYGGSESRCGWRGAGCGYEWEGLGEANRRAPRPVWMEGELWVQGGTTSLMQGKVG